MNKNGKRALNLAYFCFFLYKQEKKAVFMFLCSLSRNKLWFLLYQLVCFGYFFSAVSKNFLKLTKRESRFYDDVLKKGFYLVSNTLFKRVHLKKSIKKVKLLSMDSENSVKIDGNRIEYIYDRFKNFKENLLVEVLKRPPVIGFNEKADYVKKNGYVTNYRHEDFYSFERSYLEKLSPRNKLKSYGKNIKKFNLTPLNKNKYYRKKLWHGEK